MPGTQQAPHKPRVNTDRMMKELLAAEASWPPGQRTCPLPVLELLNSAQLFRLCREGMDQTRVQILAVNIPAAITTSTPLLQAHLLFFRCLCLPCPNQTLWQGGRPRICFVHGKYKLDIKKDTSEACSLRAFYIYGHSGSPPPIQDDSHFYPRGRLPRGSSPPDLTPKQDGLCLCQTFA